MFLNLSDILKIFADLMNDLIFRNKDKRKIESVAFYRKNNEAPLTLIIAPTISFQTIFW